MRMICFFSDFLCFEQLKPNNKIEVKISNKVKYFVPFSFIFSLIRLDSNFNIKLYMNILLLFFILFLLLNNTYIQIIVIEDGIKNEHIIAMIGVSPERIKCEHKNMAFAYRNI